jgi:hypothetical protein
MKVRARNYGVSNTFSEGHRRCLPTQFCLFDIDGFLLDDDGEPRYIYEGKFKMETKDRGNFIDSFDNPRNAQASFLKLLSEKTKVFICEESTDTWWRLQNGILEKSSNPKMDLYNTENRIYIEDILSTGHRISSVFLRTEGEKPCSMFPFAELLSNMLGTKLILVNDVFESNKIHLKDPNRTVTCLVNEDYEGNWYEEWEILELV